MREEFESVVGLFVDPVVLQLAPGFEDPTATLGSALANVRDSFTSTVSHAGIPYADIVLLSGCRGSADSNPLFSVIATMFDIEGPGPRLSTLELPLPATSKFALAVEFLPREDGLLVHVLYAADRYLPGTIDSLLQRILRYLESLASDGPGVSLSSVFGDQPPMPARARFARRFTEDRETPTNSAR
jgi:hypothetical protein